MKLKKWLLAIVLPVLLVVGASTISTTAKAQVLKNGITSVKIWDHSNGREATLTNGVYNLVEGGSYRFAVTFDLTAYDDQLQDGDTFTFTVPEGSTITNGTTFNMVDSETQVALGLAKLTSNGSGKGGTVTVTIQNLAEYRAKSTATGVKGTFFFDFQATTVGANQTWAYNPDETSGTLSHRVTITQRTTGGFTTVGENLAKTGGVITKRAYNSAILGKSGDYLHPWVMRINTQQNTYTDPIVITDSIPTTSAPMQFIPELLVLRSGTYSTSLSSLSNPVILTAGVDYTVTYNSSYTEFKLTILNPANRAFQLSYSTTSPADGSLVANTVKMESGGQTVKPHDNRTVLSLLVDRSSQITEGGVITADISNSLVLYKQDASTGELLQGAVFKVTTPSGQEITLSPTDANGRTQSRAFTSAEMASGQFKVEEIKAPEGYVLDSTPFNVTITSSGVVRTIKNTLDPNAVKAIDVQKIWDDANNQDGKRPSAITVDVYANGTKLDDKSVTLTGSSTAADWTGQVTNLPVFDANGKKITYTIGEAQVADYSAPVINQTTYTITNSRTPETLNVNVMKVWDDANNQDGKRPTTVNIKLYKEINGQKTEVDSRNLTEGDNWTTQFTALAKYEAGQEIAYSVEEDAVSGYTANVTGNTAIGFTVTNRYVPETLPVSGTKTWSDGDDQDGKRPSSITVNLVKEVAGVSSVVESKTVTAANNWTYDFGSLPLYEAGQRINYTITEDAVPGYTTKIEGFDITNSYTPEKMDVKVTKTWQDENNQDGKRPTEITINLTKTVNGVKAIVETKQITATDNWETTFTDLPVYEAGQKIVYSVEEDAVADYQTEITDFTITNSYTPRAVDYVVTKKWRDESNQDGKRPDSITVQLYKSVAGAAETAVASKTLTLTEADKQDDSTWSAQFTGLPQFENGQEITYSVKEDDATLADLANRGYQASILGEVLFNTYTPEQVTISGKKVWDDANNQDGKRPDSITLKIMNGSTVVEEIQVTAANDWAFTSKDLPKYAGGQEITYTVIEEGASDYTASQNKETDGSYTLTNSYTPAKTSVLGTVVWSDASDQDGIRPESLRVRLMANGAEVSSVIVSSATAWQYAFDGLAKYKDGQEITYSISVDSIDGYTIRIDGTQITNTHVPVVEPTTTSGSGTDQSGTSTTSVSAATSETGTSSETGSGSETVAAKSTKVLPKTGDNSDILAVVLGGLLSVFSGLLILIKIKRV